MLVGVVILPLLYKYKCLDSVYGADIVMTCLIELLHASDLGIAVVFFLQTAEIHSPDIDCTPVAAEALKSGTVDTCRGGLGRL